MSDGLPPGPALPGAVQALAYHRDPLGVLRSARARYGPLFTLRFPLKDPLVISGMPGALPALLDADPDRAHAGAARRSILPQASPRSPFGGDGEAQRASRRRMWPAFDPQRVESLESAIAALARERVARWPVGRPFRLLEAMRDLCTQITVRLLLGVTDQRRRVALVRAIRHMLDTPGNPPLPLPGGDEGPGGVPGRLADRLFARRSAPLVGLLRDELRQRRSREDPGGDLLGAMLSSAPLLSDEEIIDQLLIVLMAAQEPPAIALTNVLYELAGRPAVAEQFEQDSAARIPIVCEAIRLRPSASAALRKLTQPMRIGGWDLPEGTVIACPSLLLHRDPQAFPEPDMFRADRFRDGVPSGAPYLPFGGGTRRCIGEALAQAEFRAVLPAVHARLRFRRPWPREERMVVRATVLVPIRSALVTAAKR